MMTLVAVWQILCFRL